MGGAGRWGRHGQVVGRTNLVSEGDDQVELFGQLADQGPGRRLTRLDLAAGQLVLAGVLGRVGAGCAQHGGGADQGIHDGGGHDEPRGTGGHARHSSAAASSVMRRDRKQEASENSWITAGGDLDLAHFPP